MKNRKIQMHEFIVNFFKLTNRSQEFISVLLDAIVPVARSADLMLCDSFDNTLECLLKPLLVYPGKFELTSDGCSIKLKNASDLDELAECWTVEDSVKEAIEEYLKKYDMPTMEASICMEHSAENERYICGSTTYIDWIWDTTDRKFRPNTTPASDNCMKTATDLVNITRIFDLYILLSRYYEQNLMDHHYNGDTMKGYVFRYSKNGEERFFEVVRIKMNDCTSYRIQETVPCHNAPYFPDVALGVPCSKLKERKKLVEDIREIFSKAQDLDLRYDIIKYALDTVYEKIVDDRY